MVKFRRTSFFSSLGSPSHQAVASVLSLATPAAAPLREAFSSQTAQRSADALRELLAVPIVAFTDTQTVLAWSGPQENHRFEAMRLAESVLGGREYVVETATCPSLSCSIREVIAVPVVVDESVIGALLVFVEDASLETVRATTEVGHWVSTQVEMGELERARASIVGAELRALRAQISPHFVFNALTTMASFVRTDPERARELLLEFADFARYAFSTTNQFTSLSEELRAIDTFVAIERARFGDRLNLVIRVAPEVLAVKVPFLVLQPLVENALQYAFPQNGSIGTLTITAADEGSEVRIVVDDDGIGMDPELLAKRMAGGLGEVENRVRIGIVNVDERLRTIYGSAFGLVIETAIGFGTKVTIRVPKFQPGIS
jgi:two-component system, LytTR family, sensor kinase